MTARVKSKANKRMAPVNDDAFGAAPHGPAFMHLDRREWETIRWPGQSGKMLFHPRPGNANEPNAGVVRYEPGAHHPRHRHEFAQVWYVLEGTFMIGDATYGPGTMIFYPDPHEEPPLHTATGGRMVFVQYPGPTTGGRPIYDGRFNMKRRKPVDKERMDI